MANDNSTSLVNLGDLSKPADTLIKKVSSAIGGLFEPWQIKRVAKAKAEADLIKAKSDIEITDLHRRAMHRFVEEEATKQENMEEITRKSISYLNEDSNPDDMENDWVTNFFDKSRLISDDEMQNLWSKVLAGEANTPGAYSKRTVNLLSDLDKRDAELFQTLCRFGWSFGGFTPLIFDMNASIYNDVGIDFTSLSHLDSLGLIQFNGFSGFAKQRVPNNFTIFYCGEPLILKFSNENDNTIAIGNVLLTQAGLELSRISDATKVEGFYDYVKEKWHTNLA